MRNYQCRGKSYLFVLLYIVSGENKHGNERIDLLGK